MKFSDIADSVHINPRKLTHYALDTESPKGKHKAVLFEKLLGFTKRNYPCLINQIETKAVHAEWIFFNGDVFGKRYTVEILAEGTRGRKANIKTGWIIPHETREAHLITLYVIKNRSQNNAGHR